MSGQLEIPRHLKVLRDDWAALAEHLARETAAPMRVFTEAVARADVPELADWLTAEMSALSEWIAGLTAWMDGPLAIALGEPATPDQAMRRIAGRLRYFCDELIGRRLWLVEHFEEPITRAAAPRLDRVYHSLLRQLRSFVVEVVAGLDALLDPATRPSGGHIELAFTFKPDLTTECAALSAWLRRTQEGLERVPSSPMPIIPRRPSWLGYAAMTLVWIVGAAMIVAPVVAIVLYPGWSLLIAVLVGWVVLVVRHPLLALLAFILGSG
jgi:hypothetical protein